MHIRSRIAGALLLALMLWGGASATAAEPPRVMQTNPPPVADPSNRQPWLHTPGTCPPSVEGAVFAVAGQGCGGTGTSFDTSEIFPPMVLHDTASAALPCENGRTSGACYRMWYVGVDGSGTRRIGHALSPDGITWTRYIGTGAGGSVFGPSGVAGDFDSTGVSTMVVVRDGGTFRMWYSGFGNTGAIEGIGYATSPNGITWTRVPGTAGTAAPNRNAVLVERGGSADFDQEYIVAPTVIIDEASPATPCENGRTSGRCFRMWYEGVNNVSAYTFSIGHALSPDGVNWTRVAGNSGGGAVFARVNNFVDFDGNSVGVPSVVKDGALFRMWYEAKSYSTPAFSTGYVVSTDGVNWTRPVPNAPVYQGSDDPGTFSPDEVWAVRALKLGSGYRMYYTVNTRPDAQRFGLAQMTPGTPLGTLALSTTGNTYTLNFTTAAGIPAGGTVLVTLPPDIPFTAMTPGGIEGFGTGATLVADPAAVTDAASGGAARAALLVRLPNGAPAGPKMVQFSLAGSPPSTAPLLVQTFDLREVLEYGETLMNGSPPTSTPVPPTSTPVPNLMANPGFEIDANSDGRPDNWSRNASFTRTTAAVRSGSYAGRHLSTTNANYTLNQVINGLAAGQNYGFSGWVNVPATSDSFTFRLQVRWRNSSNGTIRTDTVATFTGATGGWAPTAATLTAPAGTTNAQILMAVSSLSATIYVDDFVFQAAQPAATSTPPPTATATITASPTPVPPTATATATPVPPTATSAPPAASSGALRFDGVNDEARGPQIAGLNGAQTIELWVRPAAGNQDVVVLAHGDDISGWSLELNGGRVTWWVAAAAGWRSAQNATVLAANTWYHVAVTYDGTSARVFVNGNPGTAATIGAITQGPSLRLGGLTGYGFFNGEIDTVRLSNVVRYTAAFTPPASGTLAADAGTRALYRLDEGTGQVTADASGNGYTLTLGTTAAADSADPAWIVSTAP